MMAVLVGAAQFIFLNYKIHLNTSWKKILPLCGAGREWPGAESALHKKQVVKQVNRNPRNSATGSIAGYDALFLFLLWRRGEQKDTKAFKDDNPNKIKWYFLTSRYMSCAIWQNWPLSSTVLTGFSQTEFCCLNSLQPSHLIFTLLLGWGERLLTAVAGGLPLPSGHCPWLVEI